MITAVSSSSFFTSSSSSPSAFGRRKSSGRESRTAMHLAIVFDSPFGSYSFGRCEGFDIIYEVVMGRG